MALARAWLRGSLQATGATLLLPASLLITLTIAAVGGGLGGPAALGEVFNGPALGGGGSLEQARAGLVLPLVPRRPPAAPGGPASVPSAGPTVTPVGSHHGGTVTTPTGPVTIHTPGPAGGSISTPGTPGRPASPPAPVDPGAGPPAVQSLMDRVEGLADGVPLVGHQTSSAAETVATLVGAS